MSQQGAVIQLDYCCERAKLVFLARLEGKLLTTCSFISMGVFEQDRGKLAGSQGERKKRRGGRELYRGNKVQEETFSVDAGD